MKQKARCMQAIGTEYRCKTDQYTVGRVGVEPTQCLHRGILSLEDLCPPSILGSIVSIVSHI